MSISANAISRCFDSRQVGKSRRFRRTIRKRRNIEAIWTSRAFVDTSRCGGSRLDGPSFLSRGATLWLQAGLLKL